ncbi:MAG: carbohydrate-binding family 6 protein, partial [Planctomycetota bacterium]
MIPSALRRCIAMTGKLGGTQIVLAALVFGVGSSAFAAPNVKRAAIFRDPAIPQTVFAAGEVRKALQGKSFVVTEKHLDELPREPSGTGAGVRIVIAVKDGAAKDSRSALRLEGGAGVGALAEQGYAILPDDGPTCYLVIGADPAGAMYGGLDLAEQIRIGGGLAAVVNKVAAPAIPRRGIKFNIPLDARTPSYDDTGDAAQKNIVEMWNFEFWGEFLDEMARHRFNTLTLWNPHPFPSIVKCPSYPDCALDDVCVPTIRPVYRSRAWRDPQFVSPKVLANLKVVRKMKMDEKIAHWRRVLAHAKDRGIDVYWITWNVIMNSAEGKYGITTAQDNPKTIAYLRESVRETILTYPLLTGIGVTAGEHMRSRKDQYDREKWLWRTYGLGITDAKKREPRRQVRFIHRVWQSGLGRIMTDFAANYPDPFEVGFKYARARLYSSTRPQFVGRLLEEMKQHKVAGWWNLRNDDIFNFRWGDPDYVRSFLGNLPPKELTAGYHMGSDGYVWGREHTSTEPDTPRQLEIRKHWYRFMLWGRLGYDPGLDRAFFEKVLAARFAGVDAKALYHAWQAASRIIPQVNRFHWRNWDFMWAVEICSDQRKGFHTVEDFIKCPTMEA